MRLHIYYTNEVCLTDAVQKPDLYILIDGKIHMKNKAREEYIIEPYDIFGYTSIFNKKSWIPGKAIAKELSTVVSIPREKLKSLMNNVYAVQDNTRLIDFLTVTVPGVKQLGQAGKERILSFFEKKKFKTGDVILAEGDICNCAYIINEGECKLISKKNPGIRGIPIYQGLISKTTSCFNLGMATYGEWVGDDSVILNKPIEFSVIAANNVTALKITKEDFTENLGRETQNLLKASMERKLKWRRERRKNISQTIADNVAPLDDIDTIDLEKSSKYYPIASKSTIKFIRQREQAKIDKAKSKENSLSKKKPTSNQNSFSKDRLVLNQNSANNEKSFSNLRYSSLTRRPQSELSNYNMSRIDVSQRKEYTKSSNYSNQYKHNDVHPTVRSPIKTTRLYSASTLGYFMVPVVSTQRSDNKKISIKEISYRNKVNRSHREEVKPKCFAERVRNGRPSSPNPAEIWARQNNVKLVR